MITEVNNIDPYDLATLLSRSTITTIEQRDALIAELAKDKYAGKEPSLILRMLHDKSEDSIQVRSDATWPATEEWLRNFQREMLTARPDLSAGVKQKWTVKIPAVMAAYGRDYLYNARTAPTFATIAADAINDGVCTAEQVEAFRAKWEEFVPISPVEKLFGKGVVVELSDIEEV